MTASRAISGIVSTFVIVFVPVFTDTTRDPAVRKLQLAFVGCAVPTGGIFGYICGSVFFSVASWKWAVYIQMVLLLIEAIIFTLISAKAYNNFQSPLSTRQTDQVIKRRPVVRYNWVFNSIRESVYKYSSLIGNRDSESNKKSSVVASHVLEVNMVFPVLLRNGSFLLCVFAINTFLSSSSAL